MNIFFVGLSGVPYSKRACDIRLISFARAFTEKGNKVTILNRLPVLNKLENNLDDILGLNTQIVELFKSEDKSKKITFYFLIVFSYFKEFIFLYNQNKKSHIDILHLYTGHFIDFLYYYLISRVIGAKLVYQYVEVRSSIANRGLYHKINGFLCDKFGYKFFDGIISISTYIENLVRSLSSEIPILKVPPICEIEYYNAYDPPIVTNPYILYCGSSGYMEAIKLIIDSYSLSNISNTHQLTLVLSGPEINLKKIKYYSNNKNGKVEIKSNLSYENLVESYLGAYGLLIPLSNTIQDIARFPNKICEYTACKGAIIVTNYGEIPYYFEDGKNALIAKDYSKSAILEKLNQLSAISSTDLRILKEGAHELCKSSFDIFVYNDSLDCFLKNLCNVSN